MDHVIRQARVDEAVLLTALAKRSKAHWGYSKSFMMAFEDELTVTEEKLSSNQFFYEVAEIQDIVVGFYALKVLSSTTFEVEALFVDPTYIGNGIGKKLMEQAIRFAKNQNVIALSIQSDPNAASFYEAMGCIKVGEKESDSIPGRYLPLFEVRLTANAA